MARPMTTNPTDAIPSDVLELAKEAHADFARSSVKDHLTMIIARAILADRARSPLAAPVAEGWVSLPRDEVERVTEIANRNEQSTEGDRVAVRLSAPSGTAEVEPDTMRTRDALVSAKVLLRALTGPDDSVAQTAISEIDAVLSARPAVEVREPDAELVRAAKDVLAERERQKTVEGWTPEHDDTHINGEMAAAATCYAFTAARSAHHLYNYVWPWSSDWWKPDGKRRNLVKAGALIIAEIERLDRLSKHGGNDA